MGMKDGLIDYKFRCVNPHVYEFDLVYHAEGKLLNHIFEKAKKKFKKDKDLDVSGSVDKISYFVVPPNYLRLLNTIVNKHVNKLKKVVGADGIVIMSTSILGAEFIKNKQDNWDIIIHYSGDYVDKR